MRISVIGNPKLSFQIPFRCRWLGHKFEPTGADIRLMVPFLFSHIERCRRCGMGRILDIGGPKFYLPSAVDDYIAKLKAESDNRVVKAEF